MTPSSRNIHRKGSHFAHGHSPTSKPSKTYSSWDHMIQRCLNKKNGAYKWYGGRGITVCERWLLFRNFLEDMGERPQAKTLERVDNDGDYEPSNCRWATKIEQMNNQRGNFAIEFEGVKYSLTSLARKYNMQPRTLRRRIIDYGLSVKEALTIPVYSGCRVHS